MGRPPGSKNKLPRAPRVDTSIVPLDRVEELRAKARAQIETEAREAAEKQLLDDLVAQERQRTGLSEPLASVLVDLPESADRLLIDGVPYFQGQVYEVRQSVAAVMRDMMQNSWRHESIKDGKPESYYRKQRNTHVSPHGVVNGSQLQRV